MISPLIALVLTQAIDFSTPVSSDRWMYPFNATPGDRITGSLFGIYGSPDFDERDAQIYLAFDLSAVGIPKGTPTSQIQCNSLTLMIDVVGINSIPYDPTVDSGESFADPSLDLDPGRPVTLWAAAGRAGYTSCDFPEDGPFSLGPPSSGTRSVYCQGLDLNTLELVDVSNSVRDGIWAEPLAAGEIDGLDPGQPILPYDRMTFTLDVESLSARELLFGEDEFCGTLALVLASWQEPVDMSSGFHSFFMREHPDVVFGFADVATLSGQIEIIPPCLDDLDGDGNVGFADLLVVLGDWGCTDCALSDVDDDGTVGFSDVLSVIASWGDC